MLGIAQPSEAVIPLTDKQGVIPLLTGAAEMLGIAQSSEAVRPLTDKQGGNPLLTRAAEMLGIAQSSESYSVRNAGSVITSSAQNPVNNSVQSFSGSPVNITVNVSGGSEEQDLAGRIAQAVRDALSDIMNLEERVSYA